MSSNQNQMTARQSKFESHCCWKHIWTLDTSELKLTSSYCPLFFSLGRSLVHLWHNWGSPITEGRVPIRALGFKTVLSKAPAGQLGTPPPHPAALLGSCLLSCYEVLPRWRFPADWQTLLWNVASAGVSSGLFSLRLFAGDWQTATLGETCVSFCTWVGWGAPLLLRSFEMISTAMVNILQSCICLLSAGMAVQCPPCLLSEGHKFVWMLRLLHELCALREFSRVAFIIL